MTAVLPVPPPAPSLPGAVEEELSAGSEASAPFPLHSSSTTVHIITPPPPGTVHHHDNPHLHIPHPPPVHLAASHHGGEGMVRPPVESGRRHDVDVPHEQHRVVVFGIVLIASALVPRDDVELLFVVVIITAPMPASCTNKPPNHHAHLVSSHQPTNIGVNLPHPHATHSLVTYTLHPHQVYIHFNSLDSAFQKHLAHYYAMLPVRSNFLPLPLHSTYTHSSLWKIHTP
jgi:hypothetical protein